MRACGKDALHGCGARAWRLDSLPEMDDVIERTLREKIGRAQWFHRAGVGHEREARDRKDSDTER